MAIDQPWKIPLSVSCVDASLGIRLMQRAPSPSKPHSGVLVQHPPSERSVSPMSHPEGVAVNFAAGSREIGGAYPALA